jgi:hypothetical protein
MIFLMTHKIFKTYKVFTEKSAPDWLTSSKSVKGSTMDNRWFWNDYVLTLPIGKSVETVFQTITRIK